VRVKELQLVWVFLIRGSKCQVFHRFGGPTEFSLLLLLVVLLLVNLSRHCLQAVLVKPALKLRSPPLE